MVVAPSGLPALPWVEADFRTNPRLWNSGQLSPRSPRAFVDDVPYIAALLDEIEKRVPYEKSRVFVTGHSNRAGMTFRLGGELSERFAALAPVAGMLAVNDAKPKKPLPTLYIIGTKDPLQPLAGGDVQLPWGKRSNRPVAEYLAGWSKAIGCEPEPRTVSEENGLKRVSIHRGQGTDAQRHLYRGKGTPGRAAGRRFLGPWWDRSPTN